MKFHQRCIGADAYALAKTGCAEKADGQACKKVFHVFIFIVFLIVTWNPQIIIGAGCAPARGDFIVYF
jgi:hypothetical protein